jgi:hypothetical protein
MSEKMISRRGTFTLLGLAVLSFALPTTVLTLSDGEAQAQPAAPAPGGPAPLTRGEQRRAARRNARQMRRTARRNAREMRRAARRGVTPAKQQ